MSTRSIRSGTLAIGAALAALLIVAALSRTTNAFNPQPDPPGKIQFGLLGITRGQTARVSASCPELPPDPIFPPGPCRVTLSFVDADGQVLTNADGQPIRHTFNLQPGHSAFLQINGDEFVGSATGDVTETGPIRLNFRPVVVNHSLRGETPPDPCIPSLEVIDNNTARTAFVSPGVTVATGFNHNETLVRDDGR